MNLFAWHRRAMSDRVSDSTEAEIKRF